MKYSKVSFVIATYNGKKDLNNCLASIFNQNYPKNKIEVIMVDGGSTDGTLELAKVYPVRLIHNKYKVPEGKHMGKSQGVDAASGEFVILVDQDNILLGKNWIKEMLTPLFDDKSIGVSSCRLAVVRNDTLTNRYLSLIGTDPFSVYRSLEGLLGLKLLDKHLEKKEGYYVYDAGEKSQLCAGNNGSAYRKSDFDEIGGYDQDVEVMARLARSGKTKIAIPIKPRLHHVTATGFLKFIWKRTYWGYHYLAFNSEKGRDYSWLPDGKKEAVFFWNYLLSNLLILPNMLTAIKLAREDREIAWLVHPWGMFLITLVYLAGVAATPEGLLFAKRFIFGK